MPGNDQILLDQLLTAQRAAIAPELTESDFFELFSAEQTLKEYDLTYEEIKAGLSGGGNDGGIDGFYTLLNGDLLSEDDDPPSPRRGHHLAVVMVQAKRTAGFAETPVERFLTATQAIFDLSRNEQTLRQTLNERLVAQIMIFRRFHERLLPGFPSLSVRFCYSTRGDQVDTNVRRKSEMVLEALVSRFRDAEATFEFLGAQALLDLARQSPERVLQLALSDAPISTPGRSAFVCLVKLGDYFAFISDPQTGLRRWLFDSNVRDYQGGVEVNEAIATTLREPPGDDDFWWLNNGVTVVAGDATYAGGRLTLSDPQIVNGLQTSTEIATYWQSTKPVSEDRRVLVRVIVPPAAVSRDRIIKATNNQTRVSASSLRATERIHRDIEDYLLPRGLFYDRRKNQYKNAGKPAARIIGISHLGQAVMAAYLGRPNDARARPSSLLKADDVYAEIFFPDAPLGLYFVCARLMKEVEAAIRESGDAELVSNWNNVRFHALRLLACLLVHRVTPSATALAAIDNQGIPAALVKEAIQTAWGLFAGGGMTDQYAKSNEFAEALETVTKDLLQRSGQQLNLMPPS